MTTAETIYTARIAYPDYTERAREQIAQLPIYRDGALVAPDSGTFALYDPTNAVLQTGAISVVDDIATATILAASVPSTLLLGHGYRQEWALSIDGVSRTYRRDAALVLHAAYPVITDADVDAGQSDLSRHRAASVTTWQGYIDEAWRRILGRLEMQGIFPEHVVTSWSLREVHLELVYHLIAADFASSQGGRWFDVSSSHKREFELAWKRLRFTRATGDTGEADSNDMHSAQRGVTFINGAPGTGWGGGWGL